MKYDSYTRFLKSQMYKDCIVYEMECKPLNQLINIFTQPPPPIQQASSNNNNNNSITTNTERKDKKRSVILPWTKGNYFFVLVFITHTRICKII